ncbi:MAG: hydrogenase maturation nickel metallochaperone HypA/HybF [Planctomycetota bacterium]|jgi:hydrogenase nickel incorporation protein HypA/HybF
MHETTVILALLEQVASFVPDGAVLTEVRIEVGQLEHLDEDLMQAAWSAMTEGSDMARVEMHIGRAPLRVRCRGCQHEYEPQETVLLHCPQCGGARPEILQGSGVLLRSIEVEQPTEAEVI